MGILIWIVLGAIIGWLGFRLAGDPGGSGCLTNIVVGIGGAMLGGAALSMITGEDYLFTTDGVMLLINVVVSAFGAAVLILGLRWLGRR